MRVVSLIELVGSIGIAENNMETTVVIWVILYIRRMVNRMETTIVYSGSRAHRG